MLFVGIEELERLSLILVILLRNCKYIIRNAKFAEKIFIDKVTVNYLHKTKVNILKNYV
jgi:hypothetical protein